MRDARRRRLAQRMPFYYGWAVLAAAALPNYSSRAVMAATTLSVFVVPMTDHFGWSRGVFSGALSLAGLFAVAVSPLVGPLIDRYGSGVIVAAGSALIGACAVGLSTVTQAWAFYAFYVPGRMLFAIPMELGTATAVSNWFVRRRPLALAILGASQGTGIAAMPLVAQAIISGWSWRVAWASLGAYSLVIGVLPVLLLMARRPEDLGMDVDPGPARRPRQPGEGPARTPPDRYEPGGEADYGVHDALRTRAFWVLAAFSASGFVVQGAVIMHQAAHFISQGLSPSAAALPVSTFALSQVLGGVGWSIWARRVPVRFLLSLNGLAIALGAIGTGASGSLGPGLASAVSLGIGIGGLHFLLRLVWADYYGRRSLGSIRGLTLPVQIGGQAIGPVISGFVFDATGTYRWAFMGVGAVACLGSLMVLAATPPRAQPTRPRHSPGV